MVDFPHVLGGLLRGRAAVKEVPEWRAEFRADLASAVSGGQWPQARRASVRGWTEDNLCQLCFGAPGTLGHRSACPCTRPAGGWSTPPPLAARALARLAPPRAELLRTRGLLTARLPRPPPHSGESFRWLSDPPDAQRLDVIWYFDGSFLNGRWGIFASAGFAIVVVSDAGDLLAFGSGVPPPLVCAGCGS